MPLLRKVTTRELRELYEHMRRDFPTNERLPYVILKNSAVHGRLQACYLQEENGTICGYAVCVVPPKSDYFHIQYIAVLPEHRSKGYGTAFLEMLQKRFGRSHMILEVEDPAKAETPEECEMREKRIAFYQRAGLRVLENMQMHLFGVPMLCMTNNPQPLEDPAAMWRHCYLLAAGTRGVFRFMKVAVFEKDLGSRPPEESSYHVAIPTGVYRHFKGGKYRVLYLARHSETLEVMVVYQALYGHKGVWTRPASMWNDMVPGCNEICRRFTYLGKEGEVD